MFWKKKGPQLGDYRIAEVFVAEANTTVFKVQRYSRTLAWDCDVYEWTTKQVCSSLSNAVDWVNKYRKADAVKYHYCQ